MKKLILICTLAALLAACGRNQETASAVNPNTKTPGSPASGAPSAAVPTTSGTNAGTPSAMGGGATLAPASGKISGTVAETLEASGFTYVRLTTDQGDQWVVFRQTPVAKGARISVVVNMVADKFQSKSLKRTFDKIVFGEMEGAPPPAAGSIPPHGVAGMMPPHGQPGMLPPNGQQAGAMPPHGQQPAGEPSTEALMAMMKAQHSGKGAGPADDTPIKVAKAEGGNARTVAEIWGSRATVHDGQPVVLRGKVVKFLPGIMGKNWLHLRDGSGSGDKGDNDITVTTSDVAAVGNVVLVSGVIHLNKDFGAGYNYPVIVEEAKVK
ncbi:MAG TPA: nucleotide-binding protein [Thermoanaerobaculia bacterium]|nr:nucleotide-binding protein [Thermoanaerobaculia bacterium]